MIRRFALLAFVGALTAATATADAPTPPKRPSAGGSLAWVLTDDLELLGDTWVDLPLIVGDRNSAFFALDTRLTLERPDSDFAFRVEDLIYDLELGWRGRWGRHGVSLFAGQRGRQRVDKDGQAYAQYVGFALASPGFGSYERRRLAWRIAAGPVVQEREVRADAVLRADAQLRLGGTRRGASFEIDFGVDGLWYDGRLYRELAGGPRISIPVRDGRRASFYVHYQDNTNPLGFEQDLVVVGFAYEEGSGGRGLATGAPEVDGLIAVGGGEGRINGQFVLRVVSPPFGGDHRVVFLLDGNILTAEDTGDLYYRYHLGLERPVRQGVAGLYYYHRSNHTLAEPNDRITSIDVVEFGLESRDSLRPGRRSGVRPWGSLAAWARIGFLLDGDFGQDRRWHARGGARWRLPLFTRRATPYLLAELEGGDVERETFGAGLSVTSDLDLQVEHRSDDQYFSADRTAWLLSARYGF